MSDKCNMSIGGIDWENSFTIDLSKPSKKHIEEQKAFLKRIYEGCTYLMVMDENGFNVEKSYCNRCGYDLNKCKTYFKK